jgi:hypothetical protein
MDYLIRATWDDEAKVWVVADTAITGLVMEADTEEELVREAEALIPELLLAHNMPLKEPVKGVAIEFVKVRDLALKS